MLDYVPLVAYTSQESALLLSFSMHLGLILYQGTHVMVDYHVAVASSTAQNMDSCHVTHASKDSCDAHACMHACKVASISDTTRGE